MIPLPDQLPTKTKDPILTMRQLVIAHWTPIQYFETTYNQYFHCCFYCFHCYCCYCCCYLYFSCLLSLISVLYQVIILEIKSLPASLDPRYFLTNLAVPSKDAFCIICILLFSYNFSNQKLKFLVLFQGLLLQQTSQLQT